MRWASLGVAVFLAAQTAGAADWPLYRGDRAQTGTTDSPLPEAPQLLWTFATSNAVKSSAVIQLERRISSRSAGDG